MCVCEGFFLGLVLHFALLCSFLLVCHIHPIQFLPRCCSQVNANGSVMSSDIVGSIKLKTMLSGMPELRLGLNDRVLFALTGRKCAVFAHPPGSRASLLLLWATLMLPFALRLGDKGKTVMMEDVKFHQCVRLSRFESDRTISFIPPDGESELMSYRINTHVSIRV